MKLYFNNSFLNKQTERHYFDNGKSCTNEDRKSFERCLPLFCTYREFVFNLFAYFIPILSLFHTVAATSNGVSSGKQLSHVMKTTIALLHTEGNSLRTIGKKVGCSRTAVKRVVDRFKAGMKLDRLPGTGKSRKLTEVERRRIILLAKRFPTITAKELRTEIGREDVCISTILRPIHEYGKLSPNWHTFKKIIDHTSPRR